MQNDLLEGNETTNTATANTMGANMVVDAETSTADVESVTTENNINADGGADNTATFTQEQVNKMISDRLNRIYKQYGVENKEALDELINGRADYETIKADYETIKTDYDNIKADYDNIKALNDELTTSNNELAKKYAFTSRNIKPELYSDIEMYFKGKGVDINETTLDEELKSHDHWFNKPSAVIQPLGAETHQYSEESERKRASRLLGVDL